MKENKWAYLLLLSFVWGSSFILMKKALLGLSPIEIGAFRILIAGSILMFVGAKKIVHIQKKHWKPLFLVAFTATFFPGFFFAFAVSQIDSSVSAILNSLTPLITMLIGFSFFGFSFSKRQVFGVFVGLVGTLLLIVKSAEINPHQHYEYALLIFLSSIGYAYSLNMIKTKLSDLDALSITVGCFAVLMLPALLVLVFSGFFNDLVWTSEASESLFYVSLLAIVGTAMAKVLFNRLVQISSPVFSSSVTYLITVVAVAWGMWDGERLSLYQLFSVVIIFAGVYLVNKKPKKELLRPAKTVT